MYIDELQFTLIENKCTHQCPWCFFYLEGERSADILGIDMIEKFVSLNKDVSLGVNILPTGEPLLHPQLWSIMRLLQSEGFPISNFYSNLSIPISDSDIDFLVDNDVYIVSNVSFFAGEEAAQANAIDNARRIKKKLALAPSSESVLSLNRNITPIETLDFPDDLDIREASITLIDNHDLAKMANLPSTFQRFRNFYDTYSPPLDAAEYLGSMKEAVCHARTLHIYNDGGFIICRSPLPRGKWNSRYDYSEANIFKMPLSQLEASDTFKEVYNIGKNGYFHICKQCNSADYCEYLERRN